MGLVRRRLKLNFIFNRFISPRVPAGRVDVYRVNPEEMAHIATIESSVDPTTFFGRDISLDDGNLLSVAENGVSGAGEFSVFTV